MQVEEIQNRVASFPRWHYEFDLHGVVTPLAAARGRDLDAQRNRTAQRARYFFDPLLECFGGDLRGKRVLDLGCNAGYWSLEAIKAGAAFVYGVDGRQMHIDQANLVFEALDVDRDRYCFELGDVLQDDLSRHGSFDVVLCLGLMYHVAKPVEMFENIDGVSSDVLVIDTGVSTAAGITLELRQDDLADPRSGIGQTLVMFPTPSAVTYLARAFGYDAVQLEPRLTDYRGMPDYATGRRYAFIGAKSSDVSGIRASRGVRPSTNGRFVKVAANTTRSIAVGTRSLARSDVQNRRDAGAEIFGDVDHRTREFIAALRRRARRNGGQSPGATASTRPEPDATG